MKVQTDEKTGGVTLYDPKSGDPLKLHAGLDYKYYIGKGFLIERPSQEVIGKATAEKEAKVRKAIEAHVRARVLEEIMREETPEYKMEKEAEVKIRAEIAADKQEIIKEVK